ncbi:glycosyltransferase family 39 protein [Rhodobacteraceae bacterium M382]|nr:glycosyltransferase family 39 protein [Rhodobacteraceae bacterium M382]
MKPAQTRIFWILLIFGMGLRLIWALMVPVEPISDAHAYDVFARNIVAYGVYGWTPDEPSAYWPVGTSAIVAAGYALTGGSYWSVVFFNLIAGGAIIVLTQRLAMRWFGGVAGLAAMAIVAFWPNLIMFTTTIASELFFLAFCLGGLFFWKRPDGDRPFVDLVLCGLLWGAACYVRPVILLAPVALALVDVPRGVLPFARSMVRAGSVIVLIVATVAPWSERNRQVLGERELVSTNFGANLWMGNNPDSDGGYKPLPPEVREMSEIERGEYLKEKAVTYMASDPWGTAKRSLKKAVLLHKNETIGVVWNQQAIERLYGAKTVYLLKLIASGYWYLVLTGALCGLFIVGRREGYVSAIFHPATALLGYFTAVHAMIVVSDRYHMPSVPFLAVFAAVTVGSIVVQLGSTANRK